MSTYQTRHIYTRDQRTILEASFACQSHPDINEKERLAKLFNCNLIQISNWFQNHRRRIKKQQKLISLNTTSYQSECHNEYSSHDYYYYPPSHYVYSPQTFDQCVINYRQ